ncbi:MAG: glycoside hydrolase [Crocinitomicaceae bacterium]
MLKTLLIILFSAFISNIVLSQDKSKKMNGVSFVGTKELIKQKHIDPVKSLNANWITVMPFGFIANGTAAVRFNEDWQWSGETVKGIKHTIELAQKNNLKILLKPHIWLHNGWIGDLNFSNERDFQTFEKTYSNYIIEFAKLAQLLKVEVFCIGVEIKKIAVNRPKFWKELIKKVRIIYSGKLTYSSNWDNFNHISFWNELDYIGIDAYFPVSSSKTPSFQSCFIGWEKHFDAIKSFSDSIKKQVIFTEFGYRNIDYTGKEPWTESDNSTFNSQAQINAYRAIFAKFWGQSWFAGGFLWKWFPNHSETGGPKDNRFTPQNKSVEKIIRGFYRNA